MSKVFCVFALIILALLPIGCTRNVSQEVGIIEDKELVSGQKVTLIGYKELGPWLDKHQRIHIDSICGTVHGNTSGFVIVYLEYPTHMEIK